MSMSFRTMLRRNDRLSLTGRLCEPKGATQRGCQAERNLSPPSACYSLCGKVNVAHTNVYCSVD